MKWLILILLTVAVFSLGVYTGSTTVNPNDNFLSVATKMITSETVDQPSDATPTATDSVEEILTQAGQTDVQGVNLPKNTDVLNNRDSTDAIQTVTVNPEMLSGEMTEDQLMEMDENLTQQLAADDKVEEEALNDEVIEDTGEPVEEVLPAELLELESQTPVLFGKQVVLEAREEVPDPSQTDSGVLRIEK